MLTTMQCKSLRMNGAVPPPLPYLFMVCTGTTLHFTYHISWPMRRTVIFSLEILEKNNDECILF